jgi:lipid A 4'-phosphatase
MIERQVLRQGARIPRPPLWTPLALIVIASALILLFDLDQRAARWFWAGDCGWRFKHRAFVRLPYLYGTWPCLIASVAAFLTWLGSFFINRLRRARRPTAFFVLSVLLGPGLLVNAVFKDHFGRPRPRQVIEFRGKRQFRPLGVGTFAGDGKSFPSGHAATGFIWFTGAIYAWSRSRKLAWCFLAAALVHGSFMSFARMAAGAHWLSDNLLSAAFVYFTAWFLWRMFAQLEHPLISDHQHATVTQSTIGNSQSLNLFPTC